jgi:hypothetical protein
MLADLKFRLAPVNTKTGSSSSLEASLVYQEQSGVNTPAQTNTQHTRVTFESNAQDKPGHADPASQLFRVQSLLVVAESACHCCDC